MVLPEVCAMHFEQFHINGAVMLCFTEQQTRSQAAIHLAKEPSSSTAKHLYHRDSPTCASYHQLAHFDCRSFPKGEGAARCAIQSPCPQACSTYCLGTIFIQVISRIKHVDLQTLQSILGPSALPPEHGGSLRSPVDQWVHGT